MQCRAAIFTKHKTVIILLFFTASLSVCMCGLYLLPNLLEGSSRNFQGLIRAPYCSPCKSFVWIMQGQGIFLFFYYWHLDNSGKGSCG